MTTESTGTNSGEFKDLSDDDAVNCAECLVLCAEVGRCCGPGSFRLISLFSQLLMCLDV